MSTALDIFLIALAALFAVIVVIAIAGMIAGFVGALTRDELKRLRSFRDEVMLEATIAEDTGVASSIIVRAHERIVGRRDV